MNLPTWDGFAGRAIAAAATLGMAAGALLVAAPAMAATSTAGQCADTVAGATGNSGQVDHTFTSPAGTVVFEVCVKAGSDVTGGPYYFASNTGPQVAPINGTVDPNCYVRTGLGTQTATVVDGSGNGCNAISHLVFYFKPDGATTSSSPSPVAGGGTQGSGTSGSVQGAATTTPNLPRAGAPVSAGFNLILILVGALVLAGLGVMGTAGLRTRRQPQD